jgi:hypothetical protein
MSLKTWPTITSENTMSFDLSPNRVAALRKWLRAANSRLLMVQRQRHLLIANATALLQRLEQPKATRLKRPSLLSRMVKSG